MLIQILTEKVVANEGPIKGPIKGCWLKGDGQINEDLVTEEKQETKILYFLINI